VAMLTTPASVVVHTHGHREGPREVARYWSDQSIGGGAVAAKRTLEGDPRGRAWLDGLLRQETLGALRDRRPQRMLGAPLRIGPFAAVYRRVVRNFALGEDGHLRPRADRGEQGEQP